jgi:hypothetical protein
MTPDHDDLDPSDFERRKSNLLARIQEKLAQAEERHKVHLRTLARQSEVVASTKSEVGAAETAHQRQLDETRATKAVLQALEREFRDLEKTEEE